MQTDATLRNTQYAIRAPSAWWKRGGKYAAILRMSMSNHFAYIGEALLRSIFLVLIIFIFVQLWTTTYSVLGADRVGVYTLPQMVWYFAFAEAIITSTPMLWRKVSEDVKSGDVAYKLSKPYNYLLFLAADYFGEVIARFMLGFVIANGLALLLVGPITFTPGGILSTLMLLIGALVLDFLGSLAVSLLAFWVEDTSSFALIYRRLVMLLGGMMIPLDVFPEPLSSIARALPFSDIVYGPSRQWVTPSAGFFYEALPRLGISILVALGIVLLMFRAGQRNVTVNGG